MKLAKADVAAIEQKTGFVPVPESAANETGLAEHFGEDTFYLDPNGVYVFEEVEQGAFPDAGGSVGTAAEANLAIGAVDGAAPKRPVVAVQIAQVSPATGDQVTITPIPPKATALTVDLG